MGGLHPLPFYTARLTNPRRYAIVSLPKARIGKSTLPHDGPESRRRCEPARRGGERTPGSCKLNPPFRKAGSRRAARPRVKRGVLIPLEGRSITRPAAGR